MSHPTVGTAGFSNNSCDPLNSNAVLSKRFRCELKRKKSKFKRRCLLTSTTIQRHDEAARSSGLPNRRVEVNEMSAVVYKGKAIHALGPQIEVTGADADK